MILIGAVASDPGGSPPPPGLITTMTLLNTSGATQAIGYCTQMFGHPFKKGDMPAGQYPIFKTSGGTVIPYSISIEKQTWADDSLEHASFMLRLPVTIAGNSSLAVNIYSGGSAPAASGRTLSDFAAGGLDLNVLLTGQDNLSGDWTSNLNQGVSAAFSDNYVFMDGDAGKAWKIRANARQSGADHGQLEGWWYVQALVDAAGNLGGIRHFTRIIQPIYNETSPPPQYRSFAAFKTRNGSTALVDYMTTLPSAKTFTWSGSGVTLNSVANGFESCIAAKLTTTGTLPAGFDTTTLYAPAVIDADHFGIGTNFNGVAANGTGACIAPTTGGSGTHTITFYPMVSAYGSFDTAQSNGRYNYIQGAGSLANDSTILCQMNNVYWCSTKLLPPFDFVTYSPISNSAIPYFPGTAGPIGRNLAATGERSEIAEIMDYYARHIFNQTAVDEQAVRVIGLIGSHLPIALYDKATRSIPAGNGGTYTGMPAGNQNFRWNGSAGLASGFTPPSNTNVLSQGWTGTSTDHMPGFIYYPYLLTGEPQFKDQMAEYASNGLTCQYPNQDTAVVNGSVNTIGGVRNASINSTLYHGIFAGESGVRTVAWAFRDIGCAGICNFENAIWNTYFADVREDTVNGMAAYRGMLVSSANAYVTNNGMWDEGAGNNGGMWGLGYMIGAFTMVAGITESAGALAQANYMAKWPQHVASVMGTWPVGCYRQTIRKGPSSNSLYSTSDSQIGFWTWSVTWASGTNLFTLTSSPSGYTIGNDDILVWNPSEGGTPPSGMSSWTGYHVINKSGSTFQLSTTQGGAAITLVDTQASPQGVYGQITLAHNPATGAIDNTGVSGYQANVTSVSQYLNAIGGTVDATYLTNMLARVNTFPAIVAQFNAGPKYATRATY